MHVPSRHSLHPVANNGDKRQAHKTSRYVPPSLRAEKMCKSCGRPFSWRRRWAKVWDEVKYCSDACRAAR